MGACAWLPALPSTIAYYHSPHPTCGRHTRARARLVPRTPVAVPRTPVAVPRTPVAIPRTPFAVPRTPVAVPRTPTPTETPLFKGVTSTSWGTFPLKAALATKGDKPFLLLIQVSTTSTTTEKVSKRKTSGKEEKRGK